MALLKLVGLVWIFLIVLFAVCVSIGVFIEKNFEESHPVKKWWRKHIIADDPYDNDWKNFNV